MNVVIVMLDSLRADFVGAYGNPWVHTPNLDALAAEAATFDAAFVGSYPTVPERTDLLTARTVFPHRGWTPIPRDEPTLASRLAGQRGYVAMLLGDRPGLDAIGTGFQAHDQVRGQEGDRWATAPREVRLPCAPHKLRSPRGTVVQFLRNIAHWHGEDDTFPAQVFARAIRWLRANRSSQPFFLFVDSFDPHEPWVAPQNFVDLYQPDYDGEDVIYPRYGLADGLDEPELERARYLYAAETTLVDKHLGRLLEELEYLGLAASTLLVVLADHGFYLGEHGLLGKPFRTPNQALFRHHHGESPMPRSLGNLYRQATRTPLWIRHPDGLAAGQRIPAIVQHVDIAPTVLELSGLDLPSGLDGRSLGPLLEGRAGAHRQVAFSCRCASYQGDGPTHWDNAATATDGDWSLILHPRDPELGHAELYRLADDPGETANVLAEHPEEARRLQAAFLQFLRDAHAHPQALAQLWQPTA
ncbi:MAG: sulfatase [Candidatus Brocadiia bacterium]